MIKHLKKKGGQQTYIAIETQKAFDKIYTFITKPLKNQDYKKHSIVK